MLYGREWVGYFQFLSSYINNFGLYQHKKKKQLETIIIITNNRLGSKTKLTTRYQLHLYFFPRLKPLILSSNISHTADVRQLDGVDVIVDRAWLNEDLEAAPTHEWCSLGDAGRVTAVEVDTTAEEAVAAAAGSTSTTRNTALPSKTLRTLSASQSPRDEEAEEEEEEDPVKASQNAFPSLRKIVWLAIAANIACCCSFWDDEGEGVVVAEEDGEVERGLNKSRGSEAPPFGVSKGEDGGVG